MKRSCTAFVFLLLVISVKAQKIIVVPNDSAAITSVVTDGFQPYDIHIELINNTGSPASVTWGLIDYTAPAQWEVKLCDNNNCYDLMYAPGPHVSYSVPHSDTIDMKFQYTSHCVDGTGNTNVYVYITGDSAASVLQLNYQATLTSNCTSGITEGVPDHLTIYPNPVQSSFVVTGFEAAGNLMFEVYNLQGAVVKSEVKDASNRQIEISLQHLPRGSYILKAFDAAGKVAGVARLSKVE